MKLSRTTIPNLAVLLLVALAVGACGGSASGDGGPAAGSVELPDETAAEDPSTVLATIDGETITMADVHEEVGTRLAELEHQYRSQRYQVVDQTLERLLRARLIEDEAEERGITPDELVQEVTAGKTGVTDQEVRSFYQANAAQLRSSGTVDQLYPQIQAYLGQQKHQQALAEFTAELAAERDVVERLEPYRVELETEGHPSYGPEDAAVTVVEFSDFECPFCQGFLPTVDRIKEEYGDRVRLVFRQFPLESIHPHARKAAEASLCAWEQDRFWEIHDLMYREQASLTVADLKDKAERLDLDMEEFSSCLDSGRYADHVQEDLEAGVAVGVDGTPAVFVNGRHVQGGAVPFETVAEVIEDELERRSR